jgi:hypothetical protein
MLRIEDENSMDIDSNNNSIELDENEYHYLNGQNKHIKSSTLQNSLTNLKDEN